MDKTAKPVNIALHPWLRGPGAGEYEVWVGKLNRRKLTEEWRFIRRCATRRGAASVARMFKAGGQHSKVIKNDYVEYDSNYE